MTENPYRDPEKAPQWEDLANLADDRTAMMLQDFRTHAARAPKVVEELRYLGPERGWAPIYRVDDRVLCNLDVSRGALAVNFELDRAACERALGISRVAEIVKRALSQALEDGSDSGVRVELRNKSLVRAFGAFLYWLSVER